MNIILGEEQLEGINKIKNFLDSTKSAFTLSGYAGTGKSTIIKYLVEYLENQHIDYILCAPTHKAKGVLKFFTDRDAVTLHQLLALTPNIEIFNLDYTQLLFLTNRNKSLQIPVGGVVICDEASMINDDLFQLLLDKCKAYNSKVIFVGDIAQLRPVNSKYDSKVFNLEDSFTLTKIYRQQSESGLTTILSTLRKSIIPRFNPSEGKEGSLYCYNNAKDLFVNAIPIFKSAIENKNIYESKLLAYTNVRVQALNNKMREILFPGKNQYNKYEFLTCYENIEFNFFNFWNSTDYIIIEDPIKIDLYIPGFVKVPAYKLELYDSVSESSESISIIDKELPQMYWDSLTNLIENTRLEAIQAKMRKDRSSSKLWVKYFELINSFTSPIDLYYDNRVIRKKSFDYGYAMTVHKS